MRRKFSLLPTLSLLVLLVACQDAGTLLPQLDTVSTRARVVSLVQGSIVKPGDTVPVNLVFSGENSPPDAVIIRLYASADTESRNLLDEYIPTAQQVADNKIPAYRPPKLRSGSYRLVFRLSRSGSLLREETVTFFYNPNSWNISNLASYPGTMSPGGDAILDLMADVPAEAGTWVRWSRGSEVLRTAVMEGNRDRLHFTVPDRDGIYTYTVEIFPEAPASGQSYSFRSPCARDTQIIVARGSAATSAGADSDYLHRWHFTGNFEDVGRDGSGTPAFTVKGKRLFDFQNEVVGYRLGDGVLFSTTRQLLPDFRKEFVPFSIGLRFLALEDKDLVVFSSRSRDSGSGITISVASGGDLSARIWGSGFDTTVTSAKAIRPGLSSDCVLNVARLATGIQLVLEAGGAEAAFGFAPIQGSVPAASGSPAVSTGGNQANSPVATARPPAATPAASIAPVSSTAPTVRPADNVIELGSSGSSPFILDELDVYQPSGSENAGWDAFYLSVKRRYNASVKFAHDFPNDLLPAGLTVQGDVRLSQGSLIMPAGSSLHLPDLANSGRAVKLDFRFSQVSRDANSFLQIASGGMPTVTVSLDGVVRQGERSAMIPAMPINPLSCSLVPGDEGWQLQSGEFVFPVTGYHNGNGFSASLVRNAKSAQPLALIWVTGREIDQAALGMDL